MPKAKLGAKHLCASCGARFYDLNRRPVACPACGVSAEREAGTAPPAAEPADPGGIESKAGAEKVKDDIGELDDDDDDEDGSLLEDDDSNSGIAVAVADHDR